MRTHNEVPSAALKVQGTEHSRRYRTMREQRRFGIDTTRRAGLIIDFDYPLSKVLNRRQRQSTYPEGGRIGGQ